MLHRFIKEIEFLNFSHFSSLLTLAHLHLFRFGKGPIISPETLA